MEKPRRTPIVLPPGVEHGTIYAYTKHKCRCQPCYQVNSERKKALKHNRSERLLADPTLRPHGLLNTYSEWGCRCAECCDAASWKYVGNNRQGVLPVGSRD